MPKMISFESIIAASGVKLEWQPNFGFVIKSEEWEEDLFVEGDGKTTHYRLLEFVAHKLNTPVGSIAYPVIPDEVYVLGSWTGTVAGDWTLFSELLQSTEHAPLPAWMGFEVSLTEFFEFEELMCWAQVDPRMLRRFGALQEGEHLEGDSVVRGYALLNGDHVLTPPLAGTAVGKVLEKVDWRWIHGPTMPVLEELLEAIAAVEDGDDSGAAGGADEIIEETLPKWAPPKKVIVPKFVTPPNSIPIPSMEFVNVQRRAAPPPPFAAPPPAGAEGPAPSFAPKRRRGALISDMDYNSPIRAIMRRSMNDECWVASLKNVGGALTKGMAGRDKKSVTVLIGQFKKFGDDGEAIEIPDLLDHIHLLARGNVGAAATLLKQIFTDFCVDMTSDTARNRSACGDGLEGVL